ncbi:MAG: hypothetical protein ABI811_18670 [Acidobacteriota bacterium]
MKIAKTAVFFAALAPIFGQPSNIFRARIVSGNSDRGKCTIEVVVDGTAEIEIQQSDGRAREISGAPTTWRRMDCNMPLPGNPENFRLGGQKGRGRQYLLKQPGQNRGVALIRIEDTDSGSSTYKFDLEWSPSPVTGSNLDAGPRPGDNLGSGLRGWNAQVDFRSRGDGYYRPFRGSDDNLTDAVILIDPSGRVEVTLTTNRRERLLLAGNLILANRDNLTANIVNGPIHGTMEISLDGRKRVRELAMTGVGRNRFELRWQPR